MKDSTKIFLIVTPLILLMVAPLIQPKSKAVREAEENLKIARQVVEDNRKRNDDFEMKLKWAAENAVRGRLKDPKSAQFGDMYVGNEVVCGTVNAKNSYGGYSGAERFVSAGVATAIIACGA